MVYILQLFPREMLGLATSDALIIGFIFDITLSSLLQFKKAYKEAMTEDDKAWVCRYPVEAEDGYLKTWECSDMLQN